MKIERCPHCGSKMGMYSKEYLYGEEFYTFPYGESDGYSELSYINRRKSRPLYCRNCNKRITTLEKLMAYKDEPQTKLCRECNDYAGDGMYCASNHIVYDFDTCKNEPQTDDDKKHCVFCKWVYEPNVCSKCRNMNLFADVIEDEPQTDCKTCKHKDLEGCEEPCLECKTYDLYEPQTERSE